MCKSPAPAYVGERSRVSCSPPVARSLDAMVVSSALGRDWALLTYFRDGRAKHNATRRPLLVVVDANQDSPRFLAVVKRTSMERNGVKQNKMKRNETTQRDAEPDEMSASV